MKHFSDYGIDVPEYGTGERATTCPRCSHLRKPENRRKECLSVNLDDGVWHCNHPHCGWKGHLEHTEEEKRQYAAMMREARRQEETKLPMQPPVTSALTPAAVEWLRGRGISDASAAYLKWKSASVWFRELGSKADALAIPFVQNGVTVNWKYRCLQAKLFSQTKNGLQCLYGWDDVKDAATIIMTEGEMDAVSLVEADYTAVCSCPSGAPAANAVDLSGKLAFIDEAKERIFDRADRIILAMDVDDVGLRWRDAIAAAIGVEKCWTVTYPEDCKDINDVLRQHGISAVRKCIEAAQPYPVLGLATFRNFRADIDNHFRTGGSSRGLATGWQAFEKYYRLVPGSLNILTGMPSSGKSEWLDQLMLQAAALHKWRWVVFSPENQPPQVHFQKLAEKLTRKPMFARYGNMESMSIDDVDTAVETLSDIFHFVTITDQPLTVDNIIAKAKVCVVRYRVNGFVLDPYNELDHTRPSGMNETEYISSFLSKLRTFGRVHGVAVFLVAHPTKLQKNDDGEYPIPRPYDISGSAHFWNKGDNCLAVWRTSKENPQNVVYVSVQKVRDKNTGMPGTVPLYWDRATGLYYENSPAGRE